jgi:hypothetical protein
MISATRTVIRLQLRDLVQMFNSMDPSPFRDRDLDRDAEEFILSWAREVHPAHELELALHLSTPPTPAGASGIESAVQHYFGIRSEMKQRDFHQLMRRGRTSLMVGLGFLAACFVLGQVLPKLIGGAPALLLREGLTIAGWVAMWRPLEIYLYDWWPLRDEQRLLDRLSRLRVTLVEPETKSS